MSDSSSAESYVHAIDGALDSDMRFHVLGLGPVGQLFAFHLRRSLSPKHEISLLFKTAALAKRMRDRPIQIENQGVVLSTSGFIAESTLSDIYKQRRQLMERDRAQTGNMASATGGNLLLLPTSEMRKDALEFQSTEDNSESHIESLIISCKAQSTTTAIRQVAHRLTSKSTIVLLQNGVLGVHENLIEHIFQKEEERPQIILVSNTHGAWLRAPPFHTVHAGIGQLRFGIVPDGRRDFEKSLYERQIGEGRKGLRLDDIARPVGDPELSHYRSLRNTVAVLQGLKDLHPKWESFAAMQILLRQKLVVNCVINPLTTLLGCRNGQLYGEPEADRIAYRICAEAAAVFRQEAQAYAGAETDPSKVTVPPELTAEALVEECKRVMRVTSGNVSSMLADMKKGNRVTEVNYLNGYLLSLAKQHGVQVPTNATMVDLIKLRTILPIDSSIV